MCTDAEAQLATARSTVSSQQDIITVSHHRFYVQCCSSFRLACVHACACMRASERTHACVHVLVFGVYASLTVSRVPVLNALRLVA